MLLSVGFTQKPRQLDKAAVRITVASVSNRAFRLELKIMLKPRQTFRERWASGLPPIVAEENCALPSPKDMNQNLHPS
jgi:hypothetical protein